MEEQTNKLNNWKAKSFKISIRLRKWTIAWVLSMALAKFGPLYLWESNDILSLITILLTLVIGIGFIIANKDRIKGLDELQQKIQLEATALSLVVAIVVGLSYYALAQANIIFSSAEIPYLIIIMVLTYMVGIYRGYRRYK